MYSVSINGTTIESQIDGFVSGEVTGRLVPAIELSTITVGSRNGSLLKRKRIDSRELKVSYAIIADSRESLIEKYNLLNEILSYEEMQISFGDNPDVFYIGTLEKMDEPNGAKATVSGYIYFLCSDPYKYTDETTLPAIINDGVPTFSVDYDGSAPSKPVLVANVNSDCGFIAFVNSNGSIIQLGDVDEEDMEEYAASEVVAEADFDKGMGSWSLANNVLLPSDLWRNDEVQEGQVGIGTTSLTNYLLVATNYGPTRNKVHGPSVKASLPAGITDWTYEWFYDFSASSANESGDLIFTVQSENKILAAMVFLTARGTFNGSILLYVNGAKKQTIPINTNYNLSTEFRYGQAKISKFGDTVSFAVGFQNYSFRASEIADIDAKYATITMFQATYKTSSGSYALATPMISMGVSDARFTKNNVSKWRDVPNKFMNGDQVIVDCNNGTIYLNGLPAPHLGALGNDWETFALDYGLNAIGCFHSEWSATPPTFEMRYRTVYL